MEIEEETSQTPPVSQIDKFRKEHPSLLKYEEIKLAISEHFYIAKKYVREQPPKLFSFLYCFSVLMASFGGIKQVLVLLGIWWGLILIALIFTVRDDIYFRRRNCTGFRRSLWE